MLQNWIRPLNPNQYSENLQYDHTILNKTAFFQPGLSISDQAIALVGINEVGASKIRDQLYTFQQTTGPIQFVDLGQIRNRSENFITGLLLELRESNITTILIGTSKEIIPAQIHSNQSISPSNSLTVIDPHPKSDLFTPKDLQSLTQIALIGTQKHIHHVEFWQEQKSVELINLGKLRKDILETEPVLRDCDLLSFSIEAINKCEAPGQKGISNTKLTAYEGCQLMHFLGFNNRLRSLAFTHYLPELDVQNITAHLIAQFIWYYLDAVSMRVPDDPSSQSNVQSFSVVMEQHGLNISFVKSLSSGKWWILTNDGKYVSCTEKDYQLACSNTLSRRLFDLFI